MGQHDYRDTINGAPGATNEARTAPLGEIESLIQLQGSALELLGNRIGQLHKALEPILCPPPPQPSRRDDESQPDQRRPTCRVGERLYDYALSIGGIIEHVEELLRNIRL
jgi:hypothetical protein